MRQDENKFSHNLVISKISSTWNKLLVFYMICVEGWGVYYLWFYNWNYICVDVQTYLHIMLQLYNLPEYNMIQWYNTLLQWHIINSAMFSFSLSFLLYVFTGGFCWFFLFFVFFCVCVEKAHMWLFATLPIYIFFA